jgi:predicted TIM-barrel fold metal-dependent hydrolase
LNAHANLWAETSKNELCNLEVIARGVGTDRLLFGSDYPFSTYSSEIEKIRLLPGLGAEDIDCILGGNARRFLESVP